MNPQYDCNMRPPCGGTRGLCQVCREVKAMTREQFIEWFQARHPRRVA